MILVRGDILMNKEEITNKLNYIDDELVKLQNAKVMKYLCNVESYIDYLQKENCKLNHYKLLYQKVKDRNNEAIEYIEGHMMNPELMDEFEYISTSPKQLLKILKGNIEEVSDEIK